MSRPPNILWICMDQHPYANRGAVAQTLPLQTRMAREGTRYTNAFTVLPICSPARASMLTGLYPHAHGLTENDGRFGGRAGLTPSEWMVHRPLAEAGYRAAWFGKWHLDNHSDAGAFGFEGWSLPGYGYPYATPDYADYLDRRGIAAPVAVVGLPGESGTPAGTRLALCDLPDWPDYEAGAYLLDGPEEVHEAFFVADLATSWIAQNGAEPFFLRVDPWGPHPPYLATKGLLDRFNETDARPPNFFSDLAHRPAHHRKYRDTWEGLGLDDAGWWRLSQFSLVQACLVERALCGVLDALERAGIAERTLVVVSADHGDAVASNGRVANKGGLLVEETVRVPLLLRGPGLRPGAVDDALLANADLAPALLNAAGLEVPHELQGNGLQARRGGVLLQHYGLHQPLMQRCWHTGDWKLVLQEDGFAELYDLANDPCELVNLADRRRHADRRAALQRAMFAEMDRQGDSGARQDRLIANSAPG